MRILHITQRYWPVRGGAEIYMGEISAYLAEQGHSVMVATTDALDFERFWDPHRRYITVSEDVQDGVRIMRFPVRYLPLSGIAYPGIRRLLWLMSMVRWMPVGWMARLSIVCVRCSARA